MQKELTRSEEQIEKFNKVLDDIAERFNEKTVEFAEEVLVNPTSAIQRAESIITLQYEYEQVQRIRQIAKNLTENAEWGKGHEVYGPNLMKAARIVLDEISKDLIQYRFEGNSSSMLSNAIEKARGAEAAQMIRMFGLSRYVEEYERSIEKEELADDGMVELLAKRIKHLDYLIDLDTPRSQISGVRGAKLIREKAEEDIHRNEGAKAEIIRLAEDMGIKNEVLETING